MNNCKNCKEPVNGNYCSNCGEAAKLKRIDRRYIIQEIADALYAKRGVIYTAKKMLINPGKNIKHYITEDRKRYVKPITFVIITSLIYTLVCYLFHIGVEYYTQSLPEGIELPTYNFIMNWIVNYPGYANMITGLVVAFLLKLFFSKSGYNLFEVFILVCFVSGIAMLLSSVVVIFQSLAYLNLIYISALISIIYYVWAIGQFFDKKKTASYIKAFISFVLGYFIFGILIASITIFIDLVMRH